MRWFNRRSNDDFAAEVESHIEMEVDRLVAGGMSETDARFAARRAFGNPTSAKERFHDARFGSSLESLAQDARYALRGMRKAPGFAIVAVASLAIGIGANTTMFSAIDTLLLRTPAHVRDADRIHRLYIQSLEADGRTYTSPKEGYRTYLAIRDHTPGIEAAAAFDAERVSSGRGADARSLSAVFVTPSFFPLLGVRPALGRFFAAEEERDEGDHAAVLGYAAWRGQFGGDSSVLGRPIDVGGTPYTIVGVAPDGFTGVDVDRVDLWLPLGAARAYMGPQVVDPNGRSYWLEMLVKRRADVSLETLRKQTTQVYQDSRRNEPKFGGDFPKQSVLPGAISAARNPGASADARVSLWVGGVALLVLLIASANVANLLLLRGLNRSREIALRLSLGATRLRVMRHFLVEGALLALFGGASALILARWTTSVLHSFLLPNATRESILDPRLLGFTALVAILAGLLASILPALVTARRDFGTLLNGGRAMHGSTRLGLQRALIGGQVMLATVLLVGAGLFVTSLRNVRSIDLAVDVEHVLYVDAGIGTKRLGSRDRDARASNDAMYMSILESVRRLPGVARATVTAGEPLGSSTAVSIRRPNGPAPVQGQPVPFMHEVGTDYFETMGTPLVRGRYFTASDQGRGAHVAIIDEATAKQYLPDGNGLEGCVYLGDGGCTEIVGVVKNTVLWQVTGDRGTVVYVPLGSWDDLAISMLEVRAKGDPTLLIPSLRQAILATMPDLPWIDIRPIRERLAPQYRPWQLGASMFTAMGMLALCLAAIGLYGLLSYVVARRSREIGIRKALGSPTGGLVRLVVGSGLATTLVGVTVGIVIALAGGRFIASQLYGVSTRDPLVVLIAAGTLTLIATLACLAPARRAARVDPMVALRVD